MERSSIIKWLLLALAVTLAFTFIPKLFGSGGGGHPFLGVADDPAPAQATPAACLIESGEGRFQAELSTRGASLRHLQLTAGKYNLLEETPPPHERKIGDRLDLVSTTLDRRMPLRTDLRVPSAGEAQQLKYDDVDWTLAAQDGKSCTFTYKDESNSTALTKTVTATGKPFELEVTFRVENLSAAPKKHRFTIEQTAWRTKKEMEGSLGRQSEFLTETAQITSAKTTRHSPGDFEAKALEKDAAKPPAEKEFTGDNWRRAPGETRAVAVSTSYFSQILIPLEGGTANGEAQIQEVWNANDPRFAADKEKDPNYGYIFRARLAYPETELPANGSATYKVLTFNGPKERDLLKAVGHGASQVLDLGWFAPIAERLVWYVLKLHNLTGSWGWAIVLLTITVKILVTPLSLPQIKSSMAMRRLKPEMDAITAKYKDDTTQKGIAIQELYRKNGVHPVIGCLPMLLQMPIWFALYQSLQTAVELYHVPFGPAAIVIGSHVYPGVIPDLSAPGKYYIIQILLGASSFFQQKLMPPQGDPQQQKMMLYMMPAVFTFMMLFLPAGLGVYMLTNTWLGIVQQLLVERYYKSKGVGTGSIEVREKTLGEGKKPTPALGKGKARARG